VEALPNMRVQRTRSSPSALRSPLTRHPLGLLVVVLAGGTAVLIHCTSSNQVGSQQPVPANPCGPPPANTDPSVRPPKLLHRSDPQVVPGDPSPTFACISGTVQTDGSVTDLKVIKASNGNVAARALAAAREWRYSPATRDGVAIAYPIQIGMTMSNTLR
jgi:TonB family protein